MLVSQSSIDAVMRQMRDAVVDNDLRLLALINARITLNRRLRTYANQQGLPTADPLGEEWVVRYLEGANAGPLDDEAVRRLCGELVAMTDRALEPPNA